MMEDSRVDAVKQNKAIHGRVSEINACGEHTNVTFLADFQGMLNAICNNRARDAKDMGCLLHENDPLPESLVVPNNCR